MTGIEFIVRDRTTGHPLAGIVQAPTRKPTARRGLSDDTVRAIRAYGADKVPHKEIAAKFDLGVRTVGHIINRDYYLHVE